jgi:serine/threonine-protein kinase HipA
MRLMNIDIHLDGAWHACAEIALRDATQFSRYGPVTLRYDSDYALKNLLARDFRALGVRSPVDMAVHPFSAWPSFLIDLLPQGAARKRLERGSPAGLTDWALLERGAVNPAGNLRVRSAATQVPRAHQGFALDEMIARGDGFVDYAYEVGATVAGATDTQGEAPKYWVAQDAQGRWHPDNGQLGAQAQRYALLKFPLHEAGARAVDILRHEAAYQKVARMMGLRVTAELPVFIGGALLIPRFDRRVGRNGEIRLGVESVYSIAGVLDSARDALRHHQVLIELHKCSTEFDVEVLEYFRRDILNLALGNRDNHGRNTAVLKDMDGSMRLSPIFDFGPAYLDARAIVRVIRWDAERGGAIDWSDVLANLRTRFEDVNMHPANLSQIADALRNFGKALKSLPRIMLECGVDGDIIDARRENIDDLVHALSGVVAP